MRMRFLFVLLFFPIIAAAEQAPESGEDENPSWEKSVALGLNLTRGNSETLLVNGDVIVSHENKSQIYHFELSGAYGESDEDDDDEDGEEEDSKVTQQEAKAVAEYRHKFTERFYSGFATTYLYDKIADIDYRVTLKPLLGYFLVKNKTVKFNVEVSPAYVFEEVDEIEDNYFAPLIGEKLEWKISKSAKFYEKAEYLFEAEDTSNFIVEAEAGIESKITETVSLVLKVKNRFENEPADDAKQNDLSVVSSLKLTF